ncbi:GNAT family N-acetyltransferase [Alkaliphilus pronyensis]|uniref:GNAT family N-acetyltransferase n=1 Tax=Alkaliphilus pronyensis TaxID=1482732 RepID=A0A6I0FA82_9FIRM|nr:GNAT family N-acetyltransferase [Alkaliphilus pronyensis]KAB3534073.1 GNAT family N-acetyltransferase [Alkaliphilus pronyensis]
MCKKISIIEENDLRECAKIYVDIFNAEPWNDKWTEGTAFNRLRDIYCSPNFMGVKYTMEGGIKGAVFGNCEQWYEGMHFNVKEMFVTTDLQGKGIGTQLLKNIEEAVKDVDVRAIILFTEKDCKTDDFYRKNGFGELDFMAMLEKSI